jgi:hypothetical protein
MFPARSLAGQRCWPRRLRGPTSSCVSREARPHGRHGRVHIRPVPAAPNFVPWATVSGGWNFVSEQGLPLGDAAGLVGLVVSVRDLGSVNMDTVSEVE